MNWVYVEVEKIFRETDKALLCLICGEEVWLPGAVHAKGCHVLDALRGVAP